MLQREVIQCFEVLAGLTEYVWNALAIIFCSDVLCNA